MYIFDAITFDTRAAAEKVLAYMNDIIRDYKVASLADLKYLTDTPSYYTDNNYVWTNLSGAEVVRVRDGYSLKLPDIETAWECAIHKPDMEVTCGMGDISGVTKQGKPGSIVIKCKCSDPKPDMVNHPAHYQSETGLEVIDVIEAFTFDLKGIEATDTGNVIKYICRWNSKNGLEDLKKAQWYLNHLISHVEKMKKENN